MRLLSKILLVCVCGIMFSACKKERNTKGTNVDYGPADTLKINQVQIIASHNSYRLRTDSAVLAYLTQLSSGGILPASLDPKGLDYEHLSFEQQFELYGMRGLELDIYYDPNGGLYYNRHILSLVGRPTASNVPELQQPGFKMLHIKDVDYNTNYYTFKAGLQAIKNWSDQNPNHFPLFINIETKEDSPADNATLAGIGFTPALLWDAAALDAFDEEIKSVFGQDLKNVLTPDRIRGAYGSLKEMALAKAWPTIGEARGKIFFILDANPTIRNMYLAGHANFTGRAAFAYAPAGNPEAAFVIENDPILSYNAIQQKVAAGYIVRSRADDNTTQARNPADYSDMNASFSSGAQITSTDYYRPDSRYMVDTNTVWSNYSVAFPEGTVVRWNPISGANVDASLTIVNP